ncbi:MAG: aldehyde ferredoxin oxidoreductase family protein [Dehalococcoidales bacterium]|nr:aldehyde ferredoxin oxidoreductase family protein [Dehalococcoidales bacterium]
MPYGYNGRILRVDLSRGTTSVDEPDAGFYRHYIGGRGLVSYFLLRELTGGEDPLGPENKLIFATGPLTGVPIAGGGRNSVGAKSPLTNGYGDTEVGGYWGAELKHAGYDAIIFEGKAASPVYLWIDDGKAEIRDARHLWGKTTAECQKMIQEELGDSGIRIAQMGIGGENLVRYACVINDLSHAAGRTGMGAVMGSKKLKAIAVRGRQKVALADASAVNSIARWLSNDLKTNPDAVSMREDGTAGVLMPLNNNGGLPTRNFQQGVFEGADKISVEAMKATIMSGRRGCYACTIRCKPEVAARGRYDVDPVYGGPEYETLASLGSNCGIDNLEAVARGNALCNAYGLDTISTGSSIAFAMECFERGIITGEDSGGLELRFGDADTMLRLIEMIARREGIGQVLADGVARAAAAFGRGAEDFALQIKGQELPMHEPRYKQGLGVGYTISPTGADHCHNIHDTMYDDPDDMSQELANLQALGIFEPLPARELSEAKVRMLVYGSLWQHTLNCLVWCMFVPVSIERMVALVTGVTGWNTSVWELMKGGERCVAMARAFDIREGMTVKDDRLPQRFFIPFTSGPLKGVGINREKLDQAIDTYYAMAGWDRVSGTPTLVKLQELGIEWVARA